MIGSKIEVMRASDTVKIDELRRLQREWKAIPIYDDRVKRTLVGVIRSVKIEVDRLVGVVERCTKEEKAKWAPK